ncbi:MAG TPA: restriction endonuclease subunit S [Nitrospira sp.]|nr:restriction endonuclease subunit S [Nitrospira sp.]
MTLASSNEIWLSTIPTDWTPSRIRSVAQVSPKFSDGPPKKDEPCTIVPMELLSESGEINTSIQQPAEEIDSGLTLFEEGDVIFAKITPCMENGKGAFVKNLLSRYAFGSTEFHVLRPNHHIHGKFLYYCTYNPTYRAYAAENMSGAAGQKRVSTRFLKDTRIFLPSPIEQERIAAYLDESCAAIDAAVTAKRRQIETLNSVRESIVETAVTRGLRAESKGVRIDRDWIKSLPEHWTAVSIKRVVSRVDYGISESTEQHGRHPVLKMANIQAGEVTFANLEFVEEVEKDLLLDTNDLLYNRTNSLDQVGKAALFRGSKDEGVTFASYLVRLRVNHRIKPAFLNHVVNSQGFLAFARKLAIPSVQQANLNSTRYCRMLIPLPPLSEQEAICDYLGEKLGKVKQVVSTIESQIDILTSYRKSLIHECVTGQRRITETATSNMMLP